MRSCWGDGRSSVLIQKDTPPESEVKKITAAKTYWKREGDSGGVFLRVILVDLGLAGVIFGLAFMIATFLLDMS
jgi:hypothetical protein